MQHLFKPRRGIEVIHAQLRAGYCCISTDRKDMNEFVSDWLFRAVFSSCCIFAIFADAACALAAMSSVYLQALGGASGLLGFCSPTHERVLDVPAHGPSIHVNLITGITVK